MIFSSHENDNKRNFFLSDFHSVCVCISMTKKTHHTLSSLLRPPPKLPETNQVQVFSAANVQVWVFEQSLGGRGVLKRNNAVNELKIELKVFLIGTKRVGIKKNSTSCFIYIGT